MSLVNRIANGRRRRVLNDEVLSPTGKHPRVADLQPVEGTRFTHAASIENHPQVSDFIPRKIRTYALFLTAAVVCIIGLSLLQWASAGSATGQNAFNMSAPGSLAAWFSSSLLLGCSMVATLVYSLRRFRVDDYKARYRVWFGFAIVSVLMSVCAATSLHVAFAQKMATLAGWSAFSSIASWWMIPAALLSLWIGVRLVRDLAERMLAISAFAGAVVCYGCALAIQYGALPVGLGAYVAIIVPASIMLGHVLLLVSITWYARFVVLDVQGLIEHKNSITQAGGVSCKLAEGTVETKATNSSRKRSKKATPLKAAATEWVDGTEQEYDDYEDLHQSRKPSKSERKRLRKQQSNKRAA